MVQYSQLHYGHDGVIWEDTYSSRHTHNSFGSNSTRSQQNDLAGRIMWLPPKPLNATFNFEDGCHNHPVLMLSSQPKDGMVDFFIMTSLKQTSLEQRYPGPQNITRRSHYLPIDPADRHPDNGILLDVSSPGGKMQKKTYVNTEKVRTAPLSALEDYTNRKTNQPMRLSDRSLAAVKIHARYTPPTTRVSPFVTIADDESEDDYDAREEEGQDLPPPYTSRRASRVFATRPAASSPNLFTLLHSARLDVAYNGRFPALPKATARLATPQQDVPYRTQVHGYRPSGRPSLTRYGLPAAPPPTPHRPGQYGQAYRQPGHHWNHESETTPLLPRHRRAGAPEQPRESIFLLIASSVGSFLCYMADSFIAVHKASTYVGLNLFQLLLLGGLIFGIIYGAYLLVVAIVGAVVGAWQWTAQEVTYIGAAIGGFFVGIGHWFEGAWDTVVTALVSAWQWIVQGIEGIGVAIEEFFRSLEG